MDLPTYEEAMILKEAADASHQSNINPSSASRYKINRLSFTEILIHDYIQ